MDTVSNTVSVTPIAITRLHILIGDGATAIQLELTAEQARALYAELSKLYGSSWVPTQPTYVPWYPGNPGYPYYSPWTTGDPLPPNPIVTCQHN